MIRGGFTLIELLVVIAIMSSKFFARAMSPNIELK